MKINGKQFEPKANFKFARVADKKYKPEGQEFSGLEQIYQDLLSYKAPALIAFWDCATAHYGKEQPSVQEIEDALEEVIEKEGAEQLFKDAFKTMDESGFFRLQLKEFWKQLDLIEKLAKTEEEKEQGQIAKEMYVKRRKELLK